MPTAFHYHDDITQRFPSVLGGVISGTVANAPTPSALQAAYADEQAATLARIGETPLSEIPTLAAWREAFRGFGVNPTKYRSAAEALLRRLTKKGDIPSINTLVDIGNLVSIRYALPVAMFDVRDLGGNTLTVKLADGGEQFTPLGAAAAEQPEAGEVIFVGGDGDVYARRWCWRQSARSASRPDTTQLLVTVEGHHGSAPADIQSALADLETLLTEYAGLTGASGVVSATQPTFTS